MKIAIIITRSLLGLLFVAAGVMYFIAPTDAEGMGFSGDAAAFFTLLVSSGYLGAVKVVEIIGGALTLSGRYTPTGLLFLGPVVINIVLFDIFLTGTVVSIGTVAAALALFLLYAYRKNFAGILCCKSCDAS